MAAEQERIAICALTFRRPVGLKRLLDSLDTLTVPDRREVVVSIVDNDPDASAQRVVEGHDAAHRLHYIHEPTRGISSARNAAVSFALDLGADRICFIDDDEWPAPDWLIEFCATADATGAEIVTGPVFPRFDEPPPTWVIEGGFFERRRHEHNERIRYATTSTVMISAAAFLGRPTPTDTAPFDLTFGLSGGEDTHLFAQLREEGNSIVWCDRAHVFEAIPTTKVSTRWMLAREYRRGQTLSLSLRQRQPPAWRYVRRIANALLHIGSGIAMSAIGALRGRAALIGGLHEIVFGSGMLTGLAGRRYSEYATTHGT